MEKIKEIGTTKLATVATLKEIKGTCIACGGPLERRKFVDAWDAKGNPTDIFEDPYCSKCDTRWMAQLGPHDFFEGEQQVAHS